MEIIWGTDDVTLDRKDISALSSDVRVAILKSLDGQSGNVSVLAKELALAKSTVHQHLTILTDTGFVKVDDNRKWRSYTLTSKAHRILHPGTGYRILLLLGTSLFTLTIGMFFIYSFVHGYIVQGKSTIHDPLMLILGEMLLILTVVFWYLTLWLQKREKTLRV
ncbi:MAG: winged helix-turn-helix domain-containing protein [Euryarchaeota archaeon]|nr:winged helix-turn-helix domain-containing protein [Euryarchaeota archaeon]